MPRTASPPPPPPHQVCTKLAIPVPGSGHPQGGGARADYQHLEELTSLVDGHIELREALVAAGRQPPLDPSQSLTRIGVGTAQTLKMCGSTPAMLQLNRALRLELAAASDPAGCEPSQRRRAAAYEAVLHQPEARPLPLSDELVLLLAASEGVIRSTSNTRPPPALPPPRSPLPPPPTPHTHAPCRPPACTRCPPPAL